MDPETMYDFAQSRTQKFAINTEDIQYWSSRFNLWLKIKPNLGLELWTVLTNLPEKPCRSKRKRKLLGKPAAKARPILKPSSTSGWDFTPMERRQWIVIEIQESEDPSCFQMSKFITWLLRHSQKVNRQDDGAAHCDQVIDEWKKNISDDTRYWSVEMTKQFANAQYWSIDKWISVLAKGGGQKKKVSILREPELSTENSVPSCKSKTFKKYNQSCIARQQCTVTRKFHRVYLPRRRRIRNEVNSESRFDSRKSQSQNKQTSCVLHCCASDGWSRWLKEKPCATCHKQESRHTKILGNAFRKRYVGAIWSSLNTEDCNFLKQDQTQLVSTTHCLAEFIQKAICMKTKDQLYQMESVILRPRVVLKAHSQSGSQDLLVQEARSSWESEQDAESCGETRSSTADCRVPGISISTVKLQDARRQNDVTKLREMFEKLQHKETLPWRHEWKNRRSTSSVRNHNNYSKIWTKQRSSNFARILQNFTVVKYKRSPTTTEKANCELLLQSLALSLRRNSSRGPKHASSERQIMFFKAKEMLEKARQSKHGGHPTILKCKTLTWRKRGNLFRYVHNIHSFIDKISNSKEEKTSITMSIAKLDGGTTESHGETRQQHLHLQLHSGRLRNGKRVGAHVAAYIIWEMLVISASWTEFQKIDGAWWQDTHSQNTSAQHSLFTSAERTPRAWLKSHGLQCHLCAPEESSHLVSHMSHPLLLSHLPFTSSTSSSSITLPSTTTQEHAAQPVQHGHLQEHPAHHAHLQALPVDKQRQQESLWRENLQSAGNPRTTAPTETISSWSYDMEGHAKKCVEKHCELAKKTTQRWNKSRNTMHGWPSI